MTRAAPAAQRVRVLVFGEDTRAFLAIVRSLGRRGCEVHAAADDLSSPALSSRYLAGVHRLTPYSESPEAWREELERLLAGHGFDLVIPCSDNNLLLLHAHRHELEGTLLSLPNEEAMAVFFDKGETRRLAARLGISTAQGRLLEGGETGAALAAELGLPLVLKPRTTFTLGQASAKHSVAIVRSEAELETALQRGIYGLAESFFAGVGVGLSVLAERGTVLQAVQHRRLQETSISGGSSSRVSEPVDPVLMQAVERLVDATALDGPAMFEFRVDRRTRQWVLLEVNPRFWGSLPLALAAGADFPASLLDLRVHGRLPTPPGYQSGVVRDGLEAEYDRIVGEGEAAGSLTARLTALALGGARLVFRLAAAERFDSFAEDDPEPWRQERAAVLDRLTGGLARRFRSQGPAAEAGT